MQAGLEAVHFCQLLPGTELLHYAHPERVPSESRKVAVNLEELHRGEGSALDICSRRSQYRQRPEGSQRPVSGPSRLDRFQSCLLPTVDGIEMQLPAAQRVCLRKAWTAQTLC